MFSLKHIIVLIVSIILICALVIFTHKWNFKKQCKALLCVGVVSEIVKIFFYIIKNESKFHGILPKTDLPFHLCSIQLLFVIFILFSKNEKLKRAVISFMLPSCLIGGFAALLIPASSAINYWVITVQYFVYHVAIIVFAINLIVSKERKFTITDYLYCLIFLLVLLFVSIYINSILYDGFQNVNFMYVVAPPQDGLPFLTIKHGWLTYILHYAFTVVACVTLCYIKPIVVAIKNRKKKELNSDK